MSGTDKLDLRRVPVTDLRPDPDNTRVHTARNLDTIEASLRQFGQRKPLVVTADMQVVSGNGTLQVVTERLGWAEIWVSVWDGTAEDARAFGVADNRTGELAEWDDSLLLDALGGLGNKLLEASGYAPEEVDDLRQLLADAAGVGAGYRYSGDDQRQTGSDTGDWIGSRFADKETWTLMFDYSNPVFAWLIGRLADRAEAETLESNADAAISMIEQVTGQTCPR